MIVEDGTGLTDSNSYVSVVFADDYFSSRGVSSWETLEESQKEILLINATDFIDNSFEWYGKKEKNEQSLRFPRINLKDYEGQEIKGIPNCLMQAVCDGANLLSKGKELFRVTNEKGDVISEKIGELSFAYALKDYGNITRTTDYDIINTKLRGLYKPVKDSKLVMAKVHRV